MFYAAFTVVFVILMLLSLWLASRRGAELLGRLIKAATVLYVALSLLDVFLPDLFMCSLGSDTLEKMSGNGLHALLRWMNLVCFTVLPIAAFRENRHFQRIACFFCLPVAAVNVACFRRYMVYFTDPTPSGLQTVRVIPQAFKALLVGEGFRAVFFGLTCLFQLVALALLTYKVCKSRERRTMTAREMGKTLLILVGVVYISLPIYVPQHLFGHVNIMLTRFSPAHIIWMAGIVSVIVALYAVFRNRSYEARYLLVLALSWALMMQFSQMFTASAELNIMKLPLQLCNLGSYLALVMLLTKNQRIYHFALIVNVVGAIIAIIILDVKKDLSHITNLWTVHYVVEHTKVLAVPILCLVLKIFKPIDKSSVKHFTVSFSAYYLFVFALGTLSNGLYRIFQGESFQNFFYANHLFMFDKDIARGLLGFTDPLFETCVIRLGAFEIYPLVQVLVYVVFMAISLGVYALIFLLTKKQRQASAKA